MADFVTVPSLPVVTLSAVGNFLGTGAEFNLPVLTLTATLSTGMSAVFTLVPVSLESALLAGGALSAEFSLPGTDLESVLLAQSIFSAEFILPPSSLSAQVLTGQLFSATPSLPVLTLAGFILSEATFSAVFNLPAEQLSAELLTLLTESYRTWVLNTRKSALTEYNNFSFNSYAIFQGQVLACGPAGVVILGTQGLDGTTPIAAFWRSGMNDFGVSVHKRVPRAYHAGSQSGDLHFKAITVEGGTRTYLLPWNNISGHTQRRIPIGRGPRSRFWQFEMSNVAGADFSTSSLMAYPQKIRRRVA